MLDGLAALGGRASLALLASHFEVPPERLLALLSELAGKGTITYDSDTRQYHLDASRMALPPCGGMYRENPLRMAEPALVRLRESLNLTGFIAVLGNRGPTIVRYERSSQHLPVAASEGRVMSMLWTATGRVFLALLDDDACRAQAEQELLAAPPELRARLDPTDPIGAICREVRRHECAIVRNTQAPGITAIAAPLRDHAERLCAVLTVMGMTDRVDPDPEGPVAQAVRHEARAASALMGCQMSGVLPA